MAGLTEDPVPPQRPALGEDLMESGWLLRFLNRLIGRFGVWMASLAFTLPVMVCVIIAVEILYFVYDVNRARIPWFGFAYLPVSLILTPPFAYMLLKVIDREGRLRRQLERRTLDFEKANRTKSEFLASMSHELRTPLNAILGYSEVIRDQSLGPGKEDIYRKYADDIHHSGSHLLSLINDLLDVSKIEAGRIQLVDETLNLSELIENCLTLVGPTMAERDIAVDNRLQESRLHVTADYRAASQVIVNLLSNAIRHNQSCTVTLSGYRSEGAVVVEIRDDGGGIPSNKMATIFEPFTEGASAHAGGGVGLGLPISKRLMQSLGGDLHLTSAPGRGTVAQLRFRGEKTQ